MYLAEFTVRPATREDFPAIRSLIHTVRINPTGLGWRRFLVAVTPQGRLLGCGQIKLHADGSREMASIAVYNNVPFASRSLFVDVNATFFAAFRCFYALTVNHTCARLRVSFLA